MSRAKRPFSTQNVLKQYLPTSPFFEDVSRETAILGGTFPDKNGKRRFSELACARTRMFTQRGVYVHGGAVAGLP